jgi:PAS domain S-box-containing protein
MMIDELKELREITNTLTKNGYLIDQAKEWEYAFDAIQDLVFIVNKYGIVKFANKSAAKKLGCPKSGLVDTDCGETTGCPYNNLVCKQNGPCSLIGDQEFYQKDVFMEPLRGWYTVSRSPVKSTTGKLLGHVCVLRDVTARVEAENKLRGAIERHELHIEKTPLAVVDLDKDFKIIKWNPTAEKIFGWSAEEVLGTTPLENILKDLDESKTGTKKIWKDLLEKKASGEHHVNINVTKHNKKIICEWFNTPLINGGGEVIGVTSIARDITKEEEADRERVINSLRLKTLLDLSMMEDASEEEIISFVLEKAVELSESEVGYIHFVEEGQDGLINLNLFKWSDKVHEFCTAKKVSGYPLSQAGVWADCLRTMAPAIHNDYQSLPDAKGLPKGHFPIKRHMSVPVIRQGKPVAIIGVGNKELPYTDVDVNQLTLFLGAMVDIVDRKKLTQSVNDMNTKLKDVQKMAKLGYWIWDLESGKVEWSDEVFDIFKRERGVFEPTIDNILELSPWEPDHGRAEELVKKLLEEGVVGGTYEQRFLYPDGGTGYYESTYKGIFDAEGKLTGLSGTVYDVTARKEADLILEKANAASRLVLNGLEQGKKELDKFESMTIVVTDDDSDILRLVSSALTKEKINILTAVNGKDAIQLAKDNYVDLFIIDLKLPDMCGTDLIAALKDICQDTTPILIMSGIDSTEIINEAMRAGAWDYIRKPFEVLDLQTTSDRLLEHGRLIKESKLLRKYIK